MPLATHLLLAPDHEVIPGVRFGRPEWVPSPAFWKAMADAEGDGGEDYVSEPGTPLLHDVVFCLLGGHGVRMEVNHAAWLRLLDRGVFERSDAETIERWLREPLQVEGRSVRYRFPRQRAERISAAIAELRDYEPDPRQPIAMRDHLMDLPGVGPKTASWIVRNWAGSDSVAILDVHVLRAGRMMGLFPANFRLPRDYPRLEQIFLQFSRALGVRPSLLDAIIWREMRILTR